LVEVRRRLANRWPTTWSRADEPRLCVVYCPAEYRPLSIGSSSHREFRPVEAPISQSITLTLVAEFVTDPRSTFQSFDTTVATDANGFFVLDFVLFVEYIESDLYSLNLLLFTELKGPKDWCQCLWRTRS
jgi:hypothetical protein